MRFPVILILLVSFCYAQNLTILAEQVASIYCPYSGLSGVSDLCSNTQSPHPPCRYTEEGLIYNPPHPPCRYTEEGLISVFPALLGVGWDPVLGQIRLPFLQMTYSQNLNITTPTSNTFAIPDQLVLSHANETYQGTASFSTMADYLDATDPSRNFITSGLLSWSSGEASALLNFFDVGQNNLMASSEYHSVYNLSLSDNVNLLPQVESALAYLPVDYDAELYGLFINYWGISIVTSGLAGGLAQQLVAVKACYGGVDTQDQAELYMLKALYPSQYQNVNFEAGFTQYSSASSLDILGGDPTLVSPNQWSARVESFYDNPILTNVQVVPITAFIKDPVKQANVAKAIQDYLANAVIDRSNLYSQSLGSQEVTYVSTFIAPVNSNWPYQVVTHLTFMQANFVSTFLLTNGSLQMGGSMQPQVVCSRDANGYVQATWHNVNAVYGILSVSVPVGSPVRSGCSMAGALVEYYGGMTMTIEGYCCQGCIPSYTPPLIMWGNEQGGTWKTTDPSDGLFTCNCAPF